MLVANKRSNNKPIIAAYADKSDGPFYCPECLDDVILKQGKIKIDHFAHKPDSSCDYGNGESQSHLSAKLNIFNELSKIDWLQCELERRLDGIRSDIFVVSKKSNRQYGIEVQASVLPLDLIQKRTKLYKKNDTHVLWLILAKERNMIQFNHKEYKVKVWERWLHTLYEERVYCWDKNLEIVPVHFAPVVSIRSSDFGVSARELKTVVEIKTGPTILFPNAFKSTVRERFKFEDDFMFPESKIVTDNLRAWWNIADEIYYPSTRTYNY